MNLHSRFPRLFLRGLLFASLSLALPVLAPIAGSAAMAAEEAVATATVSPKEIGKNMRCPVCGMFPARYPKWQAQVIFKDGDLRAIDSPVDLFRFLHNLPRYERKHAEQGRAAIAAIYLTDHVKGGWVDARQAWFVAGSSARGPMNNADLPAFNGRPAAERFAASNGGRVLAFEEITAELVANLEHETAAATRHEHEHEHPDHDHHAH
ncbi:MAG: nitrous oxide reductase accessory protein NosL [Sterolibacterium sp.]|nr:nitrous oxide reductase accessory protein NosL [Sterolibacterium sp.]